MPARIDNAAIAEWLALEAENFDGHLRRAFRRAARQAFLWPVEAVDLHDSGRSLTELPAIGPFLAKRLTDWIVRPPSKSRPPPLRRNFLTLATARRVLGSSPLPPLCGDLQMHSIWSDGSGTIRQMAEAGQGRGYQYIAITDHSKGLKIAGGITEEELQTQIEEIDLLNQELSGFTVLRGIELNLSIHGLGDMDPDSLKGLDVIVGSFHSRLRVTEDQTERYLAAIKNPQVHILGHPRGRIYNHRLGLTADWPRVFAAAAALDKAVEIDAYPDRQDLDVELLKIARDSGVKLAIDTDAHHPEQLAFAELGLAAAALVEFPPERIVNMFPIEKLLDWLNSIRATRPRRKRTGIRRKAPAHH